MLVEQGEVLFLDKLRLHMPTLGCRFKENGSDRLFFVAEFVELQAGGL